MYTIIALTLCGVLIVVALYQWQKIHNLKKDRAYWAEQAAENLVRGNHWNKQFNEVIEGEDGAWARRMLSENQALSKGLDEAIDDHMQEQQTWGEKEEKYRNELLQEKNISQGWKHLYEEKQAQLDDVHQTALAMQIELTHSEPKTPEQNHED